MRRNIFDEGYDFPLARGHQAAGHDRQCSGACALQDDEQAD
jgi:hypothetical protein